MAVNKNAPVIIKRKKKIIAGGHHGGAWKVAYADFVTAMMAFFMLMWLLNATTEKQRKGIADYFSPTIPLSRVSGGGDGSFGGDSVFSEDTLAQNGTGAQLRKPTESNAAKGSTGVDPSVTGDTQGQNSLAKVEDALTGMSGESMVSDQAMRHIITRLTDEGLIVEMFDLPGDPLFDGLTGDPTQTLVELTAMIARVFGLVENLVAVNGFTQAQPIVLSDNPVWHLSSLRADRVRTLLQDGSLAEDRIHRVSGFADRKPIARNPMAARNNRIEIILLRNGQGG
ncbi:MAG: flagellar motor protein MotB [Paracoccaceae bacterium]